MSSILFIDPGRDAAVRRYRHEHRGDWAQAMPLVLEKHGLTVDVGSPDELLNPDVLMDRAAVLVPRLPVPWSEAAARRAVDAPGLVIAEGPPDPVAASTVGATVQAPLAAGGALFPIDDCLRRAAARYWREEPASISEPVDVPINRRPDVAWQAIPGIPLDRDRAAAWATTAWDVALLAATSESEVLAVWKANSDSVEAPALVRRGGLAVLCFSLFAFLGQRHTSAPFERGRHVRTSRPIAAEALLLGLIDLAHHRRQVTRARVRPWPSGVRWVRSVRHDFDRPLSADDTRDVLARHRRAGTRATWYFRARYAESESLQLVLGDPGHEVALHSEMLWLGPERERAALEEAIGSRVLGVAAHGGRDFFGYQGAPNQLWAEAEGLLYTELLQHGHLHPHRFPALDADGAISPLQVLCLPAHESFDLSTKPNDHRADALSVALPDFLAGRGCFQLMNHPDLHIEALFAYLESMPSEGRADWTAAEVADWWMRTHRADRLTVRSTGRAVVVSARNRIENLCVELLHPDGRAVDRSFSILAGEEVSVRG